MGVLAMGLRCMCSNASLNIRDRGTLAHHMCAMHGTSSRSCGSSGPAGGASSAGQAAGEAGGIGQLLQLCQERSILATGRLQGAEAGKATVVEG